VLEITSNSTKIKDEQEKPQLYQQLGVKEYFQYDPTADYLSPQLKGKQLVDGTYQPLPLITNADGIEFIVSPTLGLELQLRNNAETFGIAPLPKALRFYDPQTGLVLPTRKEVETQLAMAQQERDAAQRLAEQLAQRLRDLGVEPE
jgi:hypothetical protein